MFDTAKAVIASQFKAPPLMFDVPDFHKLTISKMEVRPREVSDEYFDPDFNGPKIEMPERLTIDGYDEGGRAWHMGINLETYMIESASWPVLFYHDAGKQTADLETVLLGLPSVIVTLPFWLGFNTFLWSIEVATGMNHHFYSLWRKLKDQLPTELQDYVRYALIKKTEEERRIDNV